MSIHFIRKQIHMKKLKKVLGSVTCILMGDAFSVSAGVVDLVTEVPRPENRLL